MKYCFYWTEGLALQAQYRAAAFVLALGEQAKVRLERGCEGNHWLHLFAPDAQLALSLAAAAGEQASEPQAADGDGRMCTVHMRPADAVGAGMRSGGALVLLGAAPPQFDAAATGFDFAFAWPELHHSAASLPQDVAALPRAVDACFLQPREAQLGDALLLLASPAQQHDLALWRRLQAAHAPRRVLLFNPYASGAAGDEPDAYGPMPAAARARLFAQANVVCLGAGTDANDDAFADEARALGLVVVAPTAAAQPGNADALDDKAWLQQIAQATAQAATGPRPAAGLVDWQQAARAFVAQLRPAAAGPAQSVQAAQVHIVQADAAADLLPAQAHQQVPLAAQRALVLMGAGETDTESLQQAAARCGYGVIIASLVDFAVLATQLVQSAYMARMASADSAPTDLLGVSSQDALLAALSAWMRGGGPRLLHVLHVHTPPLERRRVQRLWQQVAEQPQPAPLLVVEGPRPARAERANAATIGASVAGSDILRGLAMDAPGRWRYRALVRFPHDGGAKRSYLRPRQLQLPRAKLLEQAASDAVDSIDTEAISRGLQDNSIAALVSGAGPMVTSLRAARDRWAAKPIPVVGMVHSIHGLSFNMELLRQLVIGPIGPFDALISPSLCGKQALLAQWRSVRDWLGPRGDSQPDIDVEVVPYGIDAAYFAGRERLACRLSQAVPADALVFVQLGRFSRREKGCLLPLLLAFARVHASHPQALLLLVGKAETTAELERLRAAAQALGVAAQVRFCEGVSVEDKAQLLACADVFVTVSDNVQETYGLALLEAMAAGLPVVAPAYNGFRELVLPEQTGLLVPTMWCAFDADQHLRHILSEQYQGYGWRDLHETTAVDIDGLVHAMQRLAQDPVARRRMGEMGQARVRTHYNLAQQGRALADVVLARAQQAQRFAGVWAPPAPWVDRVDVHFRHYVSEMLGGDTEVLPGTQTDDAGWCQATLKAMDMGADSEKFIIERMLKNFGSKPRTLASLTDARMDLPRLLRCLKYGLLRRV